LQSDIDNSTTDITVDTQSAENQWPSSSSLGVSVADTSTQLQLDSSSVSAPAPAPQAISSIQDCVSIAAGTLVLLFSSQHT